MTKAQNPYDGTRIFKAIPSVDVVMAEADARRNNKADKMADLYAKPEFYQGIYEVALKRLSASDMISLADAAKAMKITVPEYRTLAKQGQALLISMGKQHFVPAWSIKKDGTVDQLRLDIAREFVLEGKSLYKFMDYFKFMTEEKADIGRHIHPQTLSMIFYTAGVFAFDCSLSVKATMNQLADLWDKEPFYGKELIQRLDQAVTHGGWDPSGGLSRLFRDRYNIPGPTIDEQRRASPQPK